MRLDPGQAVFRTICNVFIGIKGRPISIDTVFLRFFRTAKIIASRDNYFEKKIP